jgi:hypothetical protein
MAELKAPNEVKVNKAENKVWVDGKVANDGDVIIQPPIYKDEGQRQGRTLKALTEFTFNSLSCRVFMGHLL